MLTRRLSRQRQLRGAVMLITLLSGIVLPRDSAFAPRVSADSTPQTLPFSQDWSNTGQITTDDIWAGVPGIVGFRGDDLTTLIATDPQTILADGSATPLDVIANQANPNTQTTGGLAEFDGIANPTVGLQGSGTADAPHLVINVNTTGLSGVKVAYFLRDIDGSADNAVQPVALQFRVGASGNYTNIPAGFVADASQGPSLAVLVTLVSVTLPPATDNQPLVQLRIITTNAAGSDEWIGIDNINVGVPSAAELDSFTANRYPGGKVLVEWHTGLEVDNLGFNVYRETNGKRVRITPQIIAGSALMAGERTNLKAGYSYTWPDDPPTDRDARYWLEAIDLNGERTMFGPVNAAGAQAGNALPRDRGRALLLNAVGKGSRPASLGAALSRFADAPQTNGAQLTLQSDVAGRQALKISVNHEGWYRVTQPELVAAGLERGIDPRNLQLIAGGQEQHFIVNGEEDGRFDPSDYIEFYGLGLSSAETDNRVYWLAAGAEPGRRVQTVKGKGTRPAPASLTYTIERRDRTIYFAGLRNGGKENFFGAVIARDPVDQIIDLEHLDPAATGEASIEVSLQGATTLAHRVKVEVNGVFAGELSFLGQAEGVATFRVAQSVLREGRNTVRLTPLEADSDISLVGYVRISYSRALVADNNGIRLNLGKKRQATISGFSNPSIRVWDITEPDVVRLVTSQVQQQGEGYSVTVSAPKPGGRTLLALSDDQTRRVASIAANQPSNLRNVENGADFVIVAHRNFIDSVEPLQTLRESQGFKVTVVDVQDIYDEFNFGEKSAQSIKNFLAYARANWRTSPRFALLVGDASLDPKNYMDRGDYDFVPTKFVDTLAMETASDEWLGDFDGDGLAELALGRLPVRTAAETSRIVNKIVSYDRAPMPRNILLVCDLNDGIDFESEFSRVRSLVPADVQMMHINRGELGTAAAKRQLIERLNSGLGILGYFGHGSIDQWRGDLLTSTDAGALANVEIRPLVFAITCLNGYFQDPALDSLAESLLYAEGGGAAAVWASSGMCDSGPQSIMDQEMFRIIFASRQNGDALTLGEAAMRAKSSIGDADVRLTYILFGDPTSRIK